MNRYTSLTHTHTHTHTRTHINIIIIIIITIHTYTTHQKFPSPCQSVRPQCFVLCYPVGKTKTETEPGRPAHFCERRESRERERERRERERKDVPNMEKKKMGGISCQGGTKTIRNNGAGSITSHHNTAHSTAQHAYFRIRSFSVRRSSMGRYSESVVWFSTFSIFRSRPVRPPVELATL